MAARVHAAARGVHAVSARVALVLLAAAALLAGCSASGLDAKTSFACKAPDGVTCMSVSGVYETSRQNALPGQLAGSSSTTPKADPPAGASAPSAQQRRD